MPLKPGGPTSQPPTQNPPRYVPAAHPISEISVPRLRNQRLKTALAVAGIRCDQLANVVGVDYKTAQRWVYEGRVPHRKSALLVGQLLGVDPEWLWPTSGVPVSSADLVCVYTNIGDVPVHLWQHMIDSASKTIDIASGTTPVLRGEGMAEALTQRTAAGTPVRLCLGRKLSSPSIDGANLRRTRHPCLPGIYRADTGMLVWLAGAAPRAAQVGPVMRLARIDDNGLFDLYAGIFEALWNSAADANKVPA
jgi:hypothetical protein